MTSGWRAIARRAAAAIPLFAAVLFVLNPTIALPLKVAVAVWVALGLLRPFDGLVALAAVAPVSLLVAELAGTPGIRTLEAFALAWAGGWLLRDPPRRRHPSGHFVTTVLVVATVAASVAAQVRQYLATEPAPIAEMLRRQVLLHWWVPDPVGIAPGLHLLAGVVLMAAAVECCAGSARRARVLAGALAASAVVTGALAALITVGIGTPAQVAWQTKFAIDRFSGHLGDVNAAGSYFAMLGAVAAAMAWAATGRARLGWGLALAGAGVGLALSGSRSAFAATAIVMGVTAWLALAGRVPALRRLALPGAAALVAAGATALAVGLPVAGADLRMQFNDTSARLIAADPLFGIGVGQYYRLSLLALTPELAWLYATENAHNYLLQVTAELGFVGAAAFLALVGYGLRQAARHAAGGDWLAGGALAGASAYLLTCLTGHPFLVQEAAVPFWLVLGLAAAPRSSGEPPPAPQATRVRAWPVAAVVLLVASVPFRPVVLDVSLPPSRDGLGPWTQDREGRRFRQAREYFALYVDRRAAKIAIPLRRAPAKQGRPMTVGDQIPGWAQHSTRITDEWTVLELDLPGALPLVARQRINLRVYEDGGPPADPRDAGVWVGEVEVVASHP